MWRVDNSAFFPIHRMWTAFSHAKALLQARPRQHNPQHFPIRAQAQGRFAQVIHMVVHNRESEREAPVPLDDRFSS